MACDLRKHAYEKILSRVTKKQKGNVKNILQIVVAARRPLTVQEMAVALGIASTQPKSVDKVKFDPIWLENNIRYWCGLFVFINHSRIHLIHQTAKEFLICESGSSKLTRICVDFLCCEDSGPKARRLVQRFIEYSIDDILDKDDHVESLLAYSAEHWPHHLQDAHVPMNGSSLASIFQFYDIDINSDLYDLWFTIFWKATTFGGKIQFPYFERLVVESSNGGRPQMNLIRLAALLGHEMVLEWMLELNNYCNINESDNDGRTASIWASEFGHENAVQILLDRGADVNTQGRYYAPCKQHQWSREGGADATLDRGVDVHAQGGECGSALKAASRGGEYGDSLQAASIYGHEDVVQMLLDRGADVNAQGGGYGNALQAASVGAGGDVNAQGGHYGNALQAAALRGHDKVVRILLDRGGRGRADVNAQGGKYGNTLQAASQGDREKVVRILLDRGTNNVYLIASVLDL
ncbi:Ankyrin repeat-containing domain protein [Elaphomyces granulatus]